ncbi:MAG: ABC transporter substrate-binding protein [Bacillota bacterium]|nr:ABC transporter substrate-binding protein [Bacillota bacterium]
MRFRTLAALLALALVLAAGSGCGGQKQPGAVAGDKYGGTLVIGIGADATLLDPISVMNNESGFVMSCIYDRLVHYKPGTTEVVPGLAEKWDVSPDGKVYTFYLRKGVKFHDGTPFDAQAYVKELDRILNPDNPHYYKKQAGIHSFAEGTFGLIEKYEATDQYTVRLTLKEPFAPFLANLGMVWSGVVSPAAVEKYGFGVSKHPVGTGPFVFKEWVPNDHITLEANKDYWGGRPYLDKIVFRIIPENSVRLLKLQSNEIQLVADVNPEDVPRIKQDANLTLYEQPGLTINGVRLPCTVPPFTDKRVRQALNYALDKEELNRTLYQGLAVTMKSPLPPVNWGYNDALQGYPYDPEKAKALLAEAGYPQGFETTLLTYPNPRGYNPVGPRLAVAVQEALAKIGVKARIEQLEWGSFLQTARSGKYRGMALGGWSGDNGDPDNFLYELFSSFTIPVGNTAQYTNKDLDEILVKARQTTDPKQREELYRQAQAVIMDDAPWIFVNHTKQVRASRANVKGFQLNPLQMFFDMEKVYLEK